MFNFQYIEYLYLLLAVPLLILVYFFALNRKKKTAGKIGEAGLVRLLLKNYHPRRYAIKFILILFAVVVTIFSLSNLRVASNSQQVIRNGIDVMIALDVSKSMLAQDIKPSRLERSKQLLSRIIDQLNNDRIGIVIFAGKAYLQMPLTADHGAAKMYLSAATPDAVPTQGTVIGDALRMSYSAFNHNEKKYKAIILVSDGEDHDEEALKLSRQIAAEGVVIQTVGLGTLQGSPLPDESGSGYKKDINGNTVISRLNEDELQRIAENANGRYQLFTSSDQVVSNIVSELNTMDQRPVKDDSLLLYDNYFQAFLALAFLLLIIEFFISERKRVNVSRSVLKPAVGVMMLFLSTAVFGQGSKVYIKNGNEAYENKDYQKASENYQKATEKNSDDETAAYNLGNALYKSGKKDEAISSYDKALAGMEKPVDRSNTYYNKGVVYQNNKQIHECIAMYKKALKISPDDEDARQNLQKALQQLKQQQKNQDNQDKKNQQNKDNEKKQQPSRLSKQDAEEKLKALMQQEKNLQDKLHKVKADALNKPEKDW